jgi:hypothetical protein
VTGAALRLAGTDVAFHESMARSLKAAFRVGDHVSWNSEAGRVRGVIKKKLTAATSLKARRRRRRHCLR